MKRGGVIDGRREYLVATMGAIQLRSRNWVLYTITLQSWGKKKGMRKALKK